jgi:hypothetical protein
MEFDQQAHVSTIVGREFPYNYGNLTIHNQPAECLETDSIAHLSSISEWARPVSVNSTIEAEQLTQNMLEFQGPSKEERDRAWAEFSARTDAERECARQQHAQHPNMPTYCMECNRYYEYEAQAPVEVVLQTNMMVGDYVLKRGDTAYICTRCIEEMAGGIVDENTVTLPQDYDLFTVKTLHTFYPPWC